MLRDGLLHSTTVTKLADMSHLKFNFFFCFLLEIPGGALEVWGLHNTNPFLFPTSYGLNNLGPWAAIMNDTNQECPIFQWFPGWKQATPTAGNYRFTVTSFAYFPVGSKEELGLLVPPI